MRGLVPKGEHASQATQPPTGEIPGTTERECACPLGTACISPELVTAGYDPSVERDGILSIETVEVLSPISPPEGPVPRH